MPNSSIILIREQPGQMTGSGCCGKLEGDNTEFCGENVFEENRRIKVEMGKLYMDLKDEFNGSGDNIIQVDPRNQLYLFPKLIADVFRYRPSFKDALKAIFMVFSPPAIIVNGRILFSRNLPGKEEVVHRIKAHAGQSP